MSTPRIGFVMPVKGHFDYAKAAIESLLVGTPGAVLTVYVVEDGKDPRNPDWLPKATYPHRIVYAALQDDYGPTAGWNYGMAKAVRENDFVVMGNDDVLVPSGWWEDLYYGCQNHTLDFVGPLSNSPGTTNLQQHILQHLEDYKLDDSLEAINQTQARLQTDHRHKFRSGTANGFFIAAMSDRWCSVAYDLDQDLIFPSAIFRLPSGRANPSPTITGQEDWLHQHARILDFRMGLSTGTFVFHYRSVTRGTRYCLDGQLWLRRSPS